MTLRIFVPCDAAALSMGANAVAAAVQAEIESRGIGRRSRPQWLARACCGWNRCWKSKPREGRIGYGPVSASDVKSIFAAGLPPIIRANSGASMQFPISQSNSA